MIVQVGTRLLDIVAEVLVADPSASLAEVAEAAGIGRTTLHKQYATRDDLIRAVAHRGIDLFEDAIAGVPDDDADGGLLALAQAMVPIGPQLAFLWRTPSFDHDPGIVTRWNQVETRACAVIKRAQQRGVITSGVSQIWLVQALYSLVYSAAEMVRAGLLAPREAPRLVLDTYVHGLGARPPEATPHGGAS